MVKLTFCVFAIAEFIKACGGSISSETPCNALHSVYENDSDHDGVVEAVYYYTYAIDGNEIKVETDLYNDGGINEIYCYSQGSDMRNRSFQ